MNDHGLGKIRKKQQGVMIQALALNTVGSDISPCTGLVGDVNSLQHTKPPTGCWKTTEKPLNLPGGPPWAAA